jgi:hypothetical protein
MSQKTKKKPAPEAASAAVPVPSKPSPPHVVEALARFSEYNSKVPPGIALKLNEAGNVDIDTNQPALKNGMVALMDAVGTHDVDFFSGYVTQIVNATDTKDGTDATAANSALGFIRSIKPRDETEAQLAAQMATTHAAVMTFARRLNSVSTIPQQDSAINAYNKLARTYAAQMEALKRYRSTGEQKVTVQHVTVSDGGQAIVGGTVTAGGGGGASKKEDTTP